MSNNGSATATADSFLMPKQRESSGGNALSEVASNRAIAEVQAAMTVAKRFPRNEIAALDRIKNACARPRLAEEALYSYKRGGTDITGPSIRLAEAIAQQWGNIDFGIREVDQENGESTVEAYAWDMETNTRSTKVFRVPHVRYVKGSTTTLSDPRDIYETVANNGSRRLRACILAIVPGDVVDEAIAACEQTLSTKCDVGPDAQKKLVAAFRDIGVSREQLEKRIQCRIDAIKPAQMVQLRKVFASIRDQASQIADWFEVSAPAGNGSGSGATTATADALTSGAGTAAPREQTKPAAKTEPNDGGPTNADLAGTVDHSADASKKADPLPQIVGSINKAKTAAAVEAIVADELSAGHEPEIQSKIYHAGEERKAALASAKK